MWRGRLPFKSVTIEPGKHFLGCVLAHRLRLPERSSKVDHFCSRLKTQAPITMWDHDRDPR
jgi:hypothetical protein